MRRKTGVPLVEDCRQKAKVFLLPLRGAGMAQLRGMVATILAMSCCDEVTMFRK